MAELSSEPDLGESTVGSVSRFSFSALLSFLFGLVSPVVLINSTLISIAIVSIVFGLFSLIRSKHQGTSWLSSFLATGGISISLLMGGWGLTHNSQLRERLFRIAAEYGEKYLDALAKGDIDGALENWTVRTNNAAGMAGPSDLFDLARATVAERNTFLNTPGRKDVIERGTQGKWVYDGPRSISEVGGRKRIGVAFRDATRPRSPSIVLQFVRLNVGRKDVESYAWRVIDVKTE